MFSWRNKKNSKIPIHGFLMLRGNLVLNNVLQSLSPLTDVLNESLHLKFHRNTFVHTIPEVSETGVRIVFNNQS